jgi:hypothetical protein
MKRKDCKPGTKVFVQGMVLPNTSGPVCWVNPEQLFLIENFPKKRKFRKGDKVRYNPSGRICNTTSLKEGEIYEVQRTENRKGVVPINNSNSTEFILWFELELVEPGESLFNIPFPQAISRMMKGQILEREITVGSGSLIQHRILNGTPQFRFNKSEGSTPWSNCSFENEDIMAMWRIVE